MAPPPSMPAYRTIQVSESGESESTSPPQISASPPSSPAETFSRALASAGPAGVAISASNPGSHFPPTAPPSVFGTGPVSDNPFGTMTTAGAPPLPNDALNPSFGMFSPSIPPTGGGPPAGWHSVAASFATRANDLARRTLAPFQGPEYVGPGASSSNQAFHSPVAPGSAPSPPRAGSELGGFVDTGASCGQRQKTIHGASVWGSLEPPNDLSASFGADRAAVVGPPSSFTAAASTWALAGSACCRCPQRASSAFGSSSLPALALMGAGAATGAMNGARRVSAFASSSSPVTTAGAAQGSFMPPTMVPDRCTTCGGSLPRANVSSEGLDTVGFGGRGEEGSRGLGTGDPPWRATWVEGSETEKALGGVLLMSLSAMEEYEGKSHEECRLEDYAQNRKNNLAVGGGPLDGATPKSLPVVVDGFVFAVPSKRRGTGNPAWQATPTRDGIGSSVSMSKIMSISAMWDYRNESHEELRLQDYTKNSLGCSAKGDTARDPTRQGENMKDPEWQETDMGAFVFVYPFLMSISAMAAYQSKSHEELRLEDYFKSREECSTVAPSQGSSDVPEALTTDHAAVKSSLTSAVPPQQKGTGDPAWQPVLMEVKPAIFAKVLMSISAMQAYTTKSHEELRLEYYLQNRK
ncbi:unnamed protein product [Ascophyllum nodosum]